MRRRLGLAGVLLLVLVFSAHPSGRSDAAKPPCRDLISTSDSLRKAGQYEPAREVAALAYECAIHEYGADDTLTAKVLYRLGRTYSQLGQLDSSAAAFDKCLDIFQRRLGAEHRLVGIACNALGLVLKDLSRYNEAEEHLRRALAIKGSTYGKESEEYANSLCTLADLLQLRDEYKEAEQALLRALNIRRSILGAGHPDLARAVKQLAALYQREDKMVLARSFYEKALRIQRDALGETHEDVAATLSKLASLLDDRGAFERAREYHLEAVIIWDSLGSPDLHVGLLNSARNRQMAGDLDQALLHVARARELISQQYGPDHWRMARAISQAGVIYSDLGEHRRAERLFRQAVEIARKQLGLGHTDVALYLNNQAVQLTALGEFDRAEEALRYSLSVFLQQETRNQSKIGLVLQSMAELRMAKREFGEAIQLADSAIRVMSPSGEITDETVVQCLNVKTRALLALGDATEARALADKWVPVARMFLEDKCPLTAQCLESQARAIWSDGDRMSAVETAWQGYGLIRDAVVSTLPSLTERQALAYAAQMRELAHLYLQYSLTMDEKTESRELAGVILESKGIVTEAVSFRARGMSEREGEAATGLRERQQEAMAALSDAFLSQTDHDGVAGQLDSLTELVESLEQQIGFVETGLGPESMNRVELDLISSHLPEGSALIEYTKLFSSTVSRDTEDGRYAVLICYPDGRSVVVDLGNAKPIETAMSRYRSHFREFLPGRMSDDRYGQIATELYELVWRPVEPYVAGTPLVLVAPDGPLLMLSFAGLINREGHFLVEDHTFQYLNSGRDLPSLEEAPSDSKGLVAFCDPEYDYISSGRDRSNAPKFSPADDFEGLTLRAGLSEIEAIRSLRLSPLPHTRSEVEAVAEAWKADERGEAQVLCGREATESNLREQVVGKSAIHIATHGYCLDSDVDATPSLSRSSIDEALLVNPLLRSGILLSKPAMSDSDNGILTAQEVLSLNLDGTQLVVLSACVTGLGHLEAGEGVYGLRRAFQLAGARNVVCALWSVSDVHTSELMTKFYAQWDQSVPIALREVQLSTIESLREHGKSVHPFYWGGFISIGN